ncbi:hypothetical protein TPHV1_10051 [Treponema phagedenis]|uniref:Uncharacterized protein n=1 Tax=Treponema phagedenis TaxID=162 RepID=A0A0B7GPK9_TREPH|nr:hypothetical protein TPHV1_10051 [Treponema phagedenis]
MSLKCGASRLITDELQGAQQECNNNVETIPDVLRFSIVSSINIL